MWLISATRNWLPLCVSNKTKLCVRSHFIWIIINKSGSLCQFCRFWKIVRLKRTPLGARTNEVELIQIQHSWKQLRRIYAARDCAALIQTLSWDSCETVASQKCLLNTFMKCARQHTPPKPALHTQYFCYCNVNCCCCCCFPSIRIRSHQTTSNSTSTFEWSTLYFRQRLGKTNILCEWFEQREFFSSLNWIMSLHLIRLALQCFAIANRDFFRCCRVQNGIQSVGAAARTSLNYISWI